METSPILVFFLLEKLDGDDNWRARHVPTDHFSQAKRKSSIETSAPVLGRGIISSANELGVLLAPLSSCGFDYGWVGYPRLQM
mmetsp:Transcript_10278/g.20723  ORF Transcript_10278/g.20723 Transcript_10278/m.20723 type:complete len:83 (+) Transcript_10278:238-486(+)